MTKLQIDGDWLWDRLQSVARYGATEDGGVARLAYSEEERVVIELLAGWQEELGCCLYTDDAANLFFRREGSDPSLPPLVFGSHIDSQPTGGRYDGAYGVMSGLAVLEALERQSITLPRSVEVVAWMNEEGARFAPGTMGSALFTQTRDLARTRAITNEHGENVGDNIDLHLALLDRLGIRRRPFGRPFHAFVEAHIEQGPVLEAREKTIGIVSAVQGPIWYQIDVHGRAAHAGTTPRANRRDAVVGAMELAMAMRAETLDDADEIRFTVGTFDVKPSSVNTVAHTVTFTVDLRHLDAGVLTHLNDRFHALAAQTWSGCSATLRETMNLPPLTFDPAITQAITEASQDFDAMVLPSGAFHDALHLARHCPTGMIFIPCKDGISHNPREFITRDHAAAGCQVLANTVMTLASE